MNKDKAIQLLERLQDPEPYEPMLTKDAYDAIQMAIDALSADGDTISRQAAIDALAEDMPQTYTPDGSHPADEGIFMAQEIYADCIQTLRELPPAQPERIIHCKDCEWWTKQECSPQGRCALSGMHPTGGWFCGNARRREVTE